MRQYGMQASGQAVVSAGAIPPDALTCPRCRAPAEPSTTVQSCSKCRRTFMLHAGARVNGSVVPPPVDPTLRRIKTRSAGMVLLKSNIVAPEGVLHGTLDPVTGMIPLDQSGVLFSDIYTIAVWRTGGCTAPHTRFADDHSAYAFFAVHVDQVHVCLGSRSPHDGALRVPDS